MDSSLNSIVARACKTTVMFVLAIVCASAGTASAKDSMAVSVTNTTGSPVVVNNGQAVGTIQLFYTVNASEFPLGPFATFDVKWLTSAGSGPATNYGSGVAFTLNQDQQGGYVDLLPQPSLFTLTATGQSDTSTVTIYISPDKSGNLPPSVDGTDLVGNLKLDAGPHVGTVTNIQVHIRLVHPTACIKVYDFVTDQDFTVGILDTTLLKLFTGGPKAGKVSSTTPGQYSDNVLVVNTCGSEQAFDLGIALDTSFAVNGANAVKTYTAAGEFDSTDYETIMSGTGTPNQQKLCLQNVIMAADSSFLATVHSKVKDELPQTSLPADGSFDFGASLYEQVNAGCTGTLHSMALPNPAAFTLPFTIKAN